MTLLLGIVLGSLATILAISRNAGDTLLWLPAISGIATALFTIVLTWVTWRMVIETQRLAEESARARQPQLIGRIEPL